MNEVFQKKNSLIIPNYVSPYHKEMIDSGIPLKTIIDQTKASRIRRKQNKTKQAKRAKVVGSRSKSRSEVIQEESPVELTKDNFMSQIRKAYKHEVENS